MGKIVYSSLILATSLALFVGTLALVNYYSKKESILLFIGTGFLGTAFLDGYHSIVTSTFFADYMPTDNTTLIPWSWVASQGFLSVYLFLSIIAWQKENKSMIAKPVSELMVYSASIVLTLFSFIFFAFVPLSREFFSGLVFARPEEFLPALFFLLALFGYLKKGHWKHKSFEFWLILSIIISFASQAFYMPYSDELFDVEFDLAHSLKIISYLAVLVGLLINMYHTYQQAEVANQAKSEFLNIMSHELRTPLTVILGYTPLLANPSKLPNTKKLIAALETKNISNEAISILLQNALAEYSKYVNKMNSSGKQLLTLINDMLDLSKIEANMMIIEPQVIKLDQFFKGIYRQFDKSVKDKGLSLVYTTANDNIFADERRLNQIMINLLSNAIKFTETGIIEITTSNIGDMLQFHISDTGCGISKNDIKHIFDQFTQADATATRNIGGSGLGLAITKKLIELHGGTINVNSTLGQGTTFNFTMPIARKDK